MTNTCRHRAHSGRRDSLSVACHFPSTSICLLYITPCLPHYSFANVGYRLRRRDTWLERADRRCSMLLAWSPRMTGVREMKLQRAYLPRCTSWRPRSHRSAAGAWPVSVSSAGRTSSSCRRSSRRRAWCSSRPSRERAVEMPELWRSPSDAR